MSHKFIHLQLHTEYSLCDGLIKMPALMQHLIKLNMPAAAITDQSNLYAAIKFYKEALKAGIKPIIGIDVMIAKPEKEYQHFPLLLLCQTQQGYKNLLQLISKSYLEGQATGSPIIDPLWLPEFSEGLIALSGGLKSDIGQALLAQQEDKAKTFTKRWQSLFKDRFYLSVSRIGHPDEELYINKIATLAQELSLPLAANNAVCYLKPEDFEAHETRVCINSGHILNDPARPKLHTEQQYLRSTEEMLQLFSDLPESLANTVEIAKRCNVTFDLGKYRLPHFTVPAGLTSESYLCEVAKTGLEKRLDVLFPEVSQKQLERAAYDERLQLELDVINGMGFAGYFLIVMDFTQWAKDNGIPVGPGRGSGPGSLVAYALAITDLNPITLELLFERFLNPERVSMADFDIDFCIEGRDRVIEYVMQKHGRQNVSQIITYGTMAAKGVIRDVGRVLGNNYGFVDKIAKLIPFELGITLDKALEQEPTLKERYEKEEEVKLLIDLARKLEGLARNVGKHAGGIVIAPGKLTDFVPLYCEANEANHPVTQFDKDDVEAVGLVKFDFLGLKTLTIIDKALRMINHARKQNQEAPVDLSTIALDDEKTFQLFKTCQTTAIFQLESHGMRDLIKRLKPDCFEDLIALVALFRPGPLQSGMVDDFINRKHGMAKVNYPHPLLEPVLQGTYGVILYQEQVMQIARVLAGYTLGSADILRRAMGKKKPQEMAKQRKIFCQGAVEKGVDTTLATQIFDMMEKFAAYAFNKPHSASYALIAYQTAWLKSYYPAEFMASVLTSEMDKTEKITLLLEDCQALKINIVSPDINRCRYEFHVQDASTLLYGLGAIKGVGISGIVNLVEEREKNGPYLDLFDFVRRVDLKKMNRRVLESFIKSGCFDLLNSNRSMLMANLSTAIQFAEQNSHDNLYGQRDLLSVSLAPTPPQYVPCVEWDETIRLQGEKETLGFYLTGHPLNRYGKELSQLVTCRLVDLNPVRHKVAKVAGIITEIRLRQTKRGEKMAIIKLEDGTGQLEAVCFADRYYKFQSLIATDNMVLVEGDVNFDEFKQAPRILVREIDTLGSVREKFAKQVILTTPLKNINAETLKPLLSNANKGNCQIKLRTEHNGSIAMFHLGNRWSIRLSDEIVDQMNASLQHYTIDIGY